MLISEFHSVILWYKVFIQLILLVVVSIIMDDTELIPDEGDNIIRMPDLNYEPNPKGIGHEFFLAMKKYQNSVAQIDAVTGEKDTFKSLLQRSIRTAITMQARGVSVNDIVCVCSNNHLNSAVPHISSFFIGSKVAALDPAIPINEIKYLLNQVHPKIIFVVPELENDITDGLHDMEIKADIVVFGETNENIPFSEFLLPANEEEYFEPHAAKSLFDTIIIFFSSGTTGLPKGICATHFGLLSQGTNFLLSGFQPDVSLTFASLYWISSAIFLVQSVLSGGARLICRPFDAFNAWKYIDQYKVTIMFMAPSQAIAMLKLGRPDFINTTTLLDFLIGGGKISSKNLLALRDLLPGTNVFQIYGQTEVAGLITIFRPNYRKDVLHLDNKPDSCGRPSPGFWYKVMDLETEEIVGPNKRGELRVKSQFVMNGYYNLNSDSAWDEEGWLKTGDICYYDDDRCFYIVDRIKEMLKFQSWHVAPAYLEGILQEHPAVKVAVVVGIPHEEDGDHPLGLVLLADNAGDIKPEELENYVADRVDDRQRLRAGIKFITEIPYTPTGKVKRMELRNRYLSE